MKKHKVAIPEGYEVDNLRSSIQIEESCIDEKIITIICKPIKKDLPKTWKELGAVSGFVINKDSSLTCLNANADFEEYKNAWPTRELAEAALSLSQLLQLRDHYNNGWKPSWETTDLYYSIMFNNDKIMACGAKKSSRVLTFRKERTRNEFLSNFWNLIETAKPLL